MTITHASPALRFDRGIERIHRQQPGNDGLWPNHAKPLLPANARAHPHLDQLLRARSYDESFLGRIGEDVDRHLLSPTGYAEALKDSQSFLEGAVATTEPGPDRERLVHALELLNGEAGLMGLLASYRGSLYQG